MYAHNKPGGELGYCVEVSMGLIIQHRKDSAYIAHELYHVGRNPIMEALLADEHASKKFEAAVVIRHV